MNEQLQYGISHSQARAGVSAWAMNVLEQRYDGHIPLGSIIDAMSWEEPKPLTALEAALEPVNIKLFTARFYVHSAVQRLRDPFQAKHRERNLRNIAHSRAIHTAAIAERRAILKGATS